jgi:hypothetical protein
LHCVRQLEASAHWKLPGQGPAAPAAQAPLPLQALGVSWPLLQAAAPQAVVVAG